MAPLDRPNFVSLFLAIGGYFICYFVLEFLNGVQNYIALHGQIYLINSSFGGRQGRRKAEAMTILFRVRLSNEKISKRRVTRSLKLGRAHSRSLNKIAVDPVEL